jgi:hypothetical protein
MRSQQPQAWYQDWSRLEMWSGHHRSDCIEPAQRQVHSHLTPCRALSHKRTRLCKGTGWWAAYRSSSSWHHFKVLSGKRPPLSNIGSEPMWQRRITYKQEKCTTWSERIAAWERVAAGKKWDDYEVENDCNFFCNVHFCNAESVLDWFN